MNFNVNQLNAKQLSCWHIKKSKFAFKNCRLIRSLHHLFSNFQSESHLIVNDSYRMFAENFNSFDLQSRQNKSLFSHNFDKCNLECNSRNFNFHINSHYVISQCDDLICFWNDQIRNLQIYTCSRKFFASIFDLDSRFSILEDFSLNFNLQTLSRAFRHLFV